MVLPANERVCLLKVPPGFERYGPAILKRVCKITLPKHPSCEKPQIRNLLKHKAIYTIALDWLSVPESFIFVALLLLELYLEPVP